MVHRCSYFDRYGVVESLLREDYESNVMDWVYEDDLPSEGVIFVTSRYDGSLRYVVIGEMPVMRAVIPATGEIFEIDGELSFRRLYARVLQHAKDGLRNDPSLAMEESVLIYFQLGSYAASEYLNVCGYMQRDFIKKADIACVRVTGTETGYFIERG